MEFTLYTPPLLLAAAASVVLAAAAWRRRGVPGAESLAAVMLAGSWWAVAYALEIAAGEAEVRAFWGEVKYLGVVAVPCAWLLFALRYTGRAGWLSRPNLALLAAVPLITLVLVFTEGTHHLVRAYAGSVSPGVPPEVAHGLWFWVHAAYSYLLLGAGTLLLLSALSRPWGPYRGQYAAVALGALVPWAANAAYILGTSPGGLDPTPFAFVLTGAALLWGAFRSQLLDLAPVAREATVEEMKDGVIVADARSRVVDLNPAAEHILGRHATEVVGRGVAEVMPAWAAALLERFGEAPADAPLAEESEVGTAHEEVSFGEGDTRRVYELGFSKLEDKSGGRTGSLILLRDVTERRRVEEELRTSRLRYQSVVESVKEVIFQTDEAGRWAFLNPAWTEITGFTTQESIGRNFLGFVHPDDRGRNVEGFRGLLEGKEDVLRHRIRYLTKDGGFCWTEVQCWLNLAPDGSISGTSGTLDDVTERKALEEQLAHRAFHDPLTDLSNRALFMDRLEHALARTDRRRDSVALLFLDLDNFKVINDSLGHECGDQLLVEMAGRLLRSIRPGDTAARLGGDEFAVLLEDIAGMREATRVAERVAEELRAPFALAGHEVFVTSSIGIALGGPNHDRPADLLRDADVAMYRAKAGGRARYEVFEEAMNAHSLERLGLENDLRRGLGDLGRGEFMVHYQPKVSLRTGKIVGMEALLRWEHPEHGSVPPARFIPIAEQTGLIVPLGRWVLREACLLAREWQERYPGDPPLVTCVNLSARQFQHKELAWDVARLLRETGLDPRRLGLEITESVAMQDAQSTVDTLRELKALGVKIVLDDFGTGYSSLSYLKRFPVDLLKIDKSFVDGLGEDPENTVVVSGIIGLAHTMGLAVVAEGIESAEQLARLRERGCEQGQGYYFSKPLPSEAASALLSG